MNIKSQNLDKNELHNRVRRPEWLKVRRSATAEFREVRQLVKDNVLNTVCESARCPNIGECWGQRTATFMILGAVCSRNCRFCAVETGKPVPIDFHEPERIADAVAKLQLKHAVITSVTRDDLKDGGSGLFAETITAILSRIPVCRIEALIPDFKGNKENLMVVLEAKPDILGHNVETVPRMYDIVRPQADYNRSLDVIHFSKERGALTKSGIMVGIGETFDEVISVMDDLRDAGCEIMTIGQYLQPTAKHLSVDRYVTPDEFAEYRKYGFSIGFKHIESAPLVRSSYHAAEQILFS